MRRIDQTPKEIQKSEANPQLLKLIQNEDCTDAGLDWSPDMYSSVTLEEGTCSRGLEMLLLRSLLLLWC